MTRTTASPTFTAGATDTVITEGHVCPFCGLIREITDDFDPSTPCPRCTLPDTPTTRNATKARVGPWHVRQVRNPWAPGMRFETLIALIKRGQVTKDSVVRGPTSHQLWKRACEIKGLSREFGMCYSCGGEIGNAANLCPHCNRLQEPPVNPDMLVDDRGTLSAQASAASSTSTSAPAPAAPQPSAAGADAPARQQPERFTRPAPTPLPPARNPAAPDLPPADLLSTDTFESEADLAKLQIRSTPVPQPRGVDPDDMLAVTPDSEGAALARQLTSRPPPKPRAQLRPRTPGADDALLTPQELATAFQLDFNPAGKQRRRTSRLALFALLLLLLAGGAAILLYLRPDLREEATAWSEKTYASIRQFILSRTTPAPPPAPPTRSSSAIQSAAGPTTRPKAEPRVIAPPVMPAPIATPQTTVAIAEAPPQVKTLETPQPPKVEPVSQPAPATAAVKPTPPAPAPAVESAKPVAAPASPVDAYAEAKRLWGKALDAEGNQDYVEAVNCYEQIKKLPKSVHPGGLDLHLAQARKLAK